jgi:type II secretory pathway pseudopilin PulG
MTVATKRRIKRRHGQAGHTLIEVMVAAGIFVVGALGLLRLVITSGEGLQVSSRLTQASSLARSKLEDLRNVEYDLLVDGTHQEGGGANNIGPAGTPYTSDGSSTGSFGATDGWFERSWTIVTDPALAYKTITVTVRWYDHPAKRWRSVSLVGGKSQQ